MFTYPANYIDNPSKVYDFAFLLTRKIGIYMPYIRFVVGRAYLAACRVSAIYIHSDSSVILCTVEMVLLYLLFRIFAHPLCYVMLCYVVYFALFTVI